MVVLLELISRNREYLKVYFPVMSKYVSDKEHLQAYLENKLPQGNERIHKAFLIMSKGLPVGYMILKNYVPVFRRAESAYWISEEFQGKGFTTGALKSLVEYAFMKEGIRSLHLHIASGNKGSKRVAEKCGFSFLGMRVNACHRGDGKKEDIETWRIRKRFKWDFG